MTAWFHGVFRNVGRASAVSYSLGSVVLIALASGCARQKQPPQPVGRTPTFESQAPAEPGEQPPGMPGETRDSSGMQHGMPGAGGGRTPPGQPGMPPHGGAMGEREGGAMGERENGAMGEREGGAMRGMSEHDLCGELTQNATLRAEVIPGGVQIVATPKSDAESARLSRTARRIESHLSSLESAHAPSEMSSRCALFDMGRMGARGSVAEGPDAIRIIFTSEDTANVSTLRQQAQTFVQSAGENKVR